MMTREEVQHRCADVGKSGCADEASRGSLPALGPAIRRLPYRTGRCLLGERNVGEREREIEREKAAVY